MAEDEDPETSLNDVQIKAKLPIGLLFESRPFGHNIFWEEIVQNIF